MKIHSFLVYCLLVIIPFPSLFAQKNKTTISGTVLDFEGTPMENVMIMIDGHEANAITDKDGNYKVDVKPDALRIAVVAFGNGMIEEDIASRTNIDFIFNTVALDQKEFEEEVAPGNELVNTGYNRVRKEYVATSISRLDVANSKKKYSSLFQMLMETPGLILINNHFVIQSSRDLNGFVYPLYVIDGVPVEGIPDLSPSQVKSIEVLKGAAAAIYGTRGYGGVILITTRIP